MRPCSSWRSFLALQTLAERNGFKVVENGCLRDDLSITRISREGATSSYLPSHCCSSVHQALSFFVGYEAAKRESHVGFDRVLKELFMDGEVFNEDKEWDGDTLECIANIVTASREYKALWRHT